MTDDKEPRREPFPLLGWVLILVNLALAVWILFGEGVR